MDAPRQIQADEPISDATPSGVIGMPLNPSKALHFDSWENLLQWLPEANETQLMTVFVWSGDFQGRGDSRRLAQVRKEAFEQLVLRTGLEPASLSGQASVLGRYTTGGTTRSGLLSPYPIGIAGLFRGRS